MMQCVLLCRKGVSMKKYVGHEMQIYGVQEYRLTGGKGDGMRMYRVRNAKGLEFEVSLDRCADIPTVWLKGSNYAYIAPCGYVSPRYYESKGAGFLKSFTAGFLTTCGLTAVGSPCIDDGEELGLHGSISNTPCENASHWIDDDKIYVKVVIRDASLFAHQLILEREYICPINENIIYMKDTIKNIGSKDSPLEVLYHCNMGYPLLTENSLVTVPSLEVTSRDAHAEEDIANCLNMEKPQSDYVERCYYHKLVGDTCVSIKNPDTGKGLNMRFNADELKYFTEWKMMGEHEYVLGLEPGNCTPDGRNVMRERGELKILKPGETEVYHLTFEFTEDNKC